MVTEPMSTTKLPTVVARDVSKTYGAGSAQTVALRSVSLTVDAGEMVAVVGPSGSGKSTLLACLAGLEAPTGGRVEVLGHDLATTGRRCLALLRRERIGYVFQAYNLISSLSALANVELPLRLAGRADSEQSAATALAQVGLTALADQRPDRLSGGQQQRVAIARALAVRPDVVFADEPTGALDSVAGREVLDLLHALSDAGTSVLLVTHDLAAAATAERVVVLRDGTVVDTLRRPTTDALFAALDPVRPEV